MKTTLTTHDAALRLIDDKNAKWSRAGAFALVEHLEEQEESIGEELEFCAVALRSDYSEHASLLDWVSDYGIDLADVLDAAGVDEEDADEDATEDAIREYITDRGKLIEFDGGIIVSSF
jgi:hypothetical protein